MSDVNYEIPYKIIKENALDRINYRILYGLCQGMKYSEIANYAGVSEKVVNDRITSLENAKILIRRSFPLIDISRIWNHIYFAQVKLQLAAPVRIAGVPAPPAWEAILASFEKVDPAMFKRLVRFAMIPFGTEYDVILLVTAQSLDEYTKFFSSLQKETNIERVWGTEAVPLAGIYFNPVNLPPPEEIEASTKQLLKSKYVRSIM